MIATKGILMEQVSGDGRLTGQCATYITPSEIGSAPLCESAGFSQYCEEASFESHGFEEAVPVAESRGSTLEGPLYPRTALGASTAAPSVVGTLGPRT